MALSTQEVEQYHRDGYVCPVPVMSASESLGLRRQLEAYESTQGGQLRPVERSRAFLLFKWLDDLIRDPRVLDPVEQLIGPDILCWSTIFWIKDAGSKSFVGWHQDNTYWGLSSRNVVTAWFAISDASVDAGCMKVMPGTHQGETLRHEDTYHQDNMLTRGQVIPGLDESRAVYMPLRAGEMFIWSTLLPHGNGHNQSDLPRLAQYITLNPAEPANEELRQTRIACWQERRPIPHRAFRGDPRGIEQHFGGPPVLTPLGRKLIGVDAWD